MWVASGRQSAFILRSSLFSVRLFELRLQEDVRHARTIECFSRQRACVSQRLPAQTVLGLTCGRPAVQFTGRRNGFAPSTRILTSYCNLLSVVNDNGWWE